MRKKWILILPFTLISLFLSEKAAPAETVELVTYYPTDANTGDLHVRSLTVGEAYRNQNPGDGEVLIFDRLGIGRLAPRVALDVEGSLMLEDVNGAAVLWFRNTQVNPAVTPGLYIRSDNDPTTFEAASERMFIGANGRIGIGTAAPKPVTLDLRGQMNIEDVNGTAVLWFRNTQVNPAVTPGLYIRSDDDPATFEAASERMFIGANGNVGIGTTAPQGVLDVVQDGGAMLVPRKSTAGDPAGVNGMIYYNASAGKFRVYEKGAWKDMVASGGAIREWGIVTGIGTVSFVGSEISTVTRAATGRYRVVTTNALTNRAVTVTQNDNAASRDRVFNVRIINTTTFDIYTWNMQTDESPDPDEVVLDPANTDFCFITTGS